MLRKRISLKIGKCAFFIIIFQKYSLYTNANPVTYTDPTGYFSFSELMVTQKIQSVINSVQMSSGLFKVLRWVNAITTVYDTFQQIKGLLNGEVTIGEVVYMIMSDMSIDAMLSWLCNTKLKYVLKPIMAIMAGDAAFKQMKDAWENGSTLDKVMYTAKFVAYCFGLVKQCFTGDTLVWTANGTVPIADIKVGDEVYAYDTETGDAILAEVTDISVSDTDELIHLTIDGELIRTTASHPFYTTSGEWKAAGDLMVGDRVVTMSGEATVEATEVEKLSEAVTVYNLTVEGEHNYYVAENGVLVHNMCQVADSANNGKKSDTTTSEQKPDLYHYTDANGAKGIQESGMIKVDSQGRIFVTTDEISALDANNALFMGTKGDGCGAYRVEIILADSNDINLSTNGVTQPNELIYYGTLRNGRNAYFTIKENDFQ